MANKSLWSSTEISSIFDVKFNQEWTSEGVSIDSRTINKGDIFFALKGENFDAHDYLDKVFDKGAVVAFVQRIPEGFDVYDERLVLVNNTLLSLQKLAINRRDNFKGKIVGITGSVGKTTTKEMLHCALENQGKVFATQGNLNNHIGLPLCLARMPSECDYGIFEMGMSAKGEIRLLGEICKPDVAIITNIEKVHLEFFESLKEIAEAKSEIFDNLNSPSCAIVNSESNYYDLQYEKASKADKRLVFGLKDNDNFVLQTFEQSEEISSIQAKFDNNIIKYSLKLNSKHNAINSLGVLLCVHALGADVYKSADNLFGLELKSGRGKILKVTKNNIKYKVIDDCYNASPASVKASIFELGKINGRKIAILGDMYELGDDAVKFHKNLKEDIINANIDKVFTVGSLMYNLFESLPENLKGIHCDNSSQMKEKIVSFIKDDDTILIKGSRGVRMENIVENISN